MAVNPGNGRAAGARRPGPPAACRLPLVGCRLPQSKGGLSVNRRTLWSRGLMIAGLVGMLVGAIDPLEGSPIIVVGAALAALGAGIGRSRRRAILAWGFALVGVGVAAMFVLSWFGGVAGDSGRSAWWLLVLAPYPIGWVASLVGAVLALLESCERARRTRHAAR